MSTLFDKMASRYDSLSRIEVAKIITAQVKKIIEVDGLAESLLDFGCGTGLVGLELATHFEHLYLTDTSVKMLEQVELKIADLGIKNAKTILWEDELTLPRSVR